MGHPGVLLSRGEAPGNAGVERQDRALAGVEVARRVADVDGALLHGVHHLEDRHQLAGGVGAQGERAARERLEPLGERLGGAEQRVQGPREARGQAPLDPWAGVHRGRFGSRGPVGAAGGQAHPGRGAGGLLEQVSAIDAPRLGHRLGRPRRAAPPTP